MSFYEYKCDNSKCASEWLDNERLPTLGKCVVCGRGEMKRVFSVPNLTNMPTRGRARNDFANRDNRPIPEDDD